MEQLLLEFKSRENDLLDFKVGNKVMFYSYSFCIQPDFGILLTVQRKSDTEGWNGNFQLLMPAPKKAFVKMLGGWIRNQLMCECLPSTDIGTWEERNKMIGSKEYKKAKVFCYLRSIKIAQVIAGYAWRTMMNKYNISDDTIYTYNQIIYRMFQERREGTGVMPYLHSAVTRMSPYMARIFLSDLSKYNVAFARHIMENIIRDSRIMFPDEYAKFIKNTPPIIKKNKYNLMMPVDNIEHVLKGHMPVNRWQYYAARVAITSYNPGLLDNTAFDANPMYYDYRVLKEFLLKLPKTDISLWHYFKKSYHLTGPYSTQKIKHMYQIVMDGARMYRDMRANTEGVSFVPVTGSCMHMLRNALYNHHQEQEYTKKRRLSGVNHNMPESPVKLPDWIEKIRIKTAHEMITAGIECQHCIGSYTNSNDIFVREGNICAQIMRDTFNIQQCYDVHDHITPASKSLQARLTKALKPIKDMADAISV